MGKSQDQALILDEDNSRFRPNDVKHKQMRTISSVMLSSLNLIK